jgi:hypothetical protein
VFITADELYVADEKGGVLIPGNCGKPATDGILHLRFLQEFNQCLQTIILSILLPHLCLPVTPAESSCSASPARRSTVGIP